MSDSVSATPLVGCSAQAVVACSSVDIINSNAHTNTHTPVMNDVGRSSRISNTPYMSDVGIARRIRPEGLNVESQAWGRCESGQESFVDVGGVSLFNAFQDNLGGTSFQHFSEHFTPTYLRSLD